MVTNVGVIITNTLDIAGHITLPEPVGTTSGSHECAFNTDKVTTLAYIYDDPGSVAGNLSVVAYVGVC